MSFEDDLRKAERAVVFICVPVFATTVAFLISLFFI